MFKKIALGLCLFLFFIVASVGVLTFNLDKILKPTILGKYQKKYVADLKLDWSMIDIDVKNIGFFTKEVKVRSKSQCVNYKTSEFCHELFLVRFMFSPFEQPALVILEVKVLEQKNKINLADFKSNEEKPWSPIHSQVYNTLELLNSNLSWVPENFEISSKGVVHDRDAKVLDYNALLSSQKIKMSLKMSSLALNIENVGSLGLSEESENQFKLDILTDLGDFDLHFNLRLSQRAVISNVKVEAELKSGKKLNLKTSIVSEVSADELKITLKELKTDFEPYLENLEFKVCALRMTSSPGENVDLECLKNSFIISTDNFKKSWSKKSVADLGPFFFKFKLSLAEKVFLDTQKGELGKFEYKIEEKKGDFFVFGSKATIKLSMSDEKIVFEPETFDLDLNVFSYEKMVGQLAQSPFAVPAPLNAYKGEIRLATKDLILGDKISIPVEASIRLKGDQDSEVNVSAEGVVDLTPNPKGQYEPSLNMDVVLGENIFYLPDFDPLRGLPKLNSDPRIVYTNKKTSAFLNTEPEKEGKPSGFNYNVNIKTKNKDSIKIKHRLLDPYMPLGLEAQLSHKGTILNLFTKKTWAVEYLKRKVFVSQMSITKKNIETEKYFVDALLVYKASEYDIFINAVGNIDSPAVTLRSDPPLSRSDIISVLLYNRTAKDIDRFQSESVGGAEAAFSDRALGLIGIWAFASTPIESVSYDSRSKTYRAQIALPGGVKFDIGTDWEKVQNLSLRKRISKYWMVVTSYQPGSDENEGIGDVLIQREWIF